MKVEIENNKIYIITKEYSDFYMGSVSCSTRITLGEATRLRKELDIAIQKIDENE